MARPCRAWNSGRQEGHGRAGEREQRSDEQAPHQDGGDGRSLDRRVRRRAAGQRDELAQDEDGGGEERNAPNGGVFAVEGRERNENGAGAAAGCSGAPKSSPAHRAAARASTGAADRLVRSPRRERDPRAGEPCSDGVPLEQPGSPGERPGGGLGVGEVRERIDLDDRNLVAAAAEMEERARDAPVEPRRRRDDQRLGRENPARDEARVAPAVVRSPDLALEQGVRDPILLAQAWPGMIHSTSPPKRSSPTRSRRRR